MKTIFFNRELKENIYIDKLQGFVQQIKKHLVCKLIFFL